MKRIIPGLVLAATCFSTASYAEINTSDIPATLSISGQLKNAPSPYCQITLSNSVIALTSDTGSLVEQGKNATSISLLSFTVGPVSGPQEEYSECGRKIYDGKIAVRFTGTYDNADGTTFANTATGDNAASGVGIGLFRTDNTPIDVREIYNIKDKTSYSGNFIGLQLVKLKGQTVKTGSVAGNITFQVERL
ncbi:fimbrial protein [Cronobacter malonaticus]